MEQALNNVHTNEKHSFKWTACCSWLVFVLLAYMLSAGPYMMAEQRGAFKTPNVLLQAIYEPLFYTYFHTPLHKPLGVYFHLWRSEVFDKNGEMSGQ